MRFSFLIGLSLLTLLSFLWIQIRRNKNKDRVKGIAIHPTAIFIWQGGAYQPAVKMVRVSDRPLKIRRFE